MIAVSHQPVLVLEVTEALQPQLGGKFLDVTLGLAGHSLELAKLAKQAQQPFQLWGIDQDEAVLRLAKIRLKEAQVESVLVYGNFGNLAVIAEAHHFPQFQGILFDIGISSVQLDNPERGFSFQNDGPLDMRMDAENSVTAASILNTWPEAKLTRLFLQFGEERLAGKIARGIVQYRKDDRFSSTKQLADLISRLYPISLRHRHPHPATRVFQALRIEVNRELAVLEHGLLAAYDLLAPDGRLAVISFHSLEDRIVKHAFKNWEEEGRGDVLTKKPITASETEQVANPRSRSAKLRVFQKIVPNS